MLQMLNPKSMESKVVFENVVWRVDFDFNYESFTREFVSLEMAKRFCLGLKSDDVDFDLYSVSTIVKSIDCSLWGD